jgi:hypothetical protein
VDAVAVGCGFLLLPRVRTGSDLAPTLIPVLINLAEQLEVGMALIGPGFIGVSGV